MKALSENNVFINIDGEFHFKKLYEIVVDNSGSESHNISIDRPSFSTFAFCEAEAIGKMMQSDFSFKHKPILNIIKQS
jgi:hypothetical protein